MNTSDQAKRLMTVGAWVSATLVLACAVAFGWDKGADPLIDFGRELYVPWRLTEGDVLHRDIGWFNGPLGPWLIEGWMRVFGVTLDALQWLNTVGIALTALLLARIVRRFAGGLEAWVGVVCFACVFAVAQQEAIGNFLFLSPYSHGITFGFTAALGSILALLRAIERGSAVQFAVSGALAGLCFLSKAEVSMALGLALAAYAVSGWLAGRSHGVRVKRAALFTIGAAIPIGLAYARFAAQLGPREATIAVLGTWPHAFNNEVSGMPFYKMMRGTYELGTSVARLAAQTAMTGVFVAGLFGVTAFAARRLGGPLASVPPRLGLGIKLGLGFGLGSVATVVVSVTAQLKWMLLPLSVVLPIVAVLAFVRASKRRAPSEANDIASPPDAAGCTDERARIALLAFAAFAVGLLPKVMLVPLARQYGFVLSLPGTIILIVLVVRWAPGWLERTSGRVNRSTRLSLTGAALGLVFAFTAMNANATRNWYAKKTIPFGRGGDRIMSDNVRGGTLNALLDDLEQRLGPDDKLLVLPEGITLNYQLRRETPTRIVNFMRPEFVMFGADSILEDLEASPPAAVVIIYRPTYIYGAPFFGDGYGEEVLAWVRQRYERARLIGAEPLVEAGPRAFGASILIPKAMSASD